MKVYKTKTKTGFEISNIPHFHKPKGMFTVKHFLTPPDGTVESDSYVALRGKLQSVTSYQLPQRQIFATQCKTTLIAYLVDADDKLYRIKCANNRADMNNMHMLETALSEGVSMDTIISMIFL